MLVAATPAPLSYTAAVQPLLSDNCVACHQSGQAPDGLNLEDGHGFANLVGKKSAHAPMLLVDPGAADKSYLIAKLEGSHLKEGGAGERMPLGGILPQDEIETIRRWIDEGAKP